MRSRIEIENKYNEISSREITAVEDEMLDILSTANGDNSEPQPTEAEFAKTTSTLVRIHGNDSNYKIALDQITPWLFNN